MSGFPLNAQWFAPTGTCRCGKPATGRLMGTRNEDLGTWCKPCADRAVKAAQKARGQ